MKVCVFIYQIELLDTIALNLHRIDKDVQRCDRNYWYFTPDNLEKLRNIMCRYINACILYVKKKKTFCLLLSQIFAGQCLFNSVFFLIPPLGKESAHYISLALPSINMHAFFFEQVTWSSAWSSILTWGVGEKL